VDNHTRMNTPHGDAWALSTVLFFYFGGSPTPTISDSVISGNTVTVIAPEGEGKIEGVGLTNNGPLLLTRVQVTDNTGTCGHPPAPRTAAASGTDPPSPARTPP